MVPTEYCDRELDIFISEKIMEKQGSLFYTANMSDAWEVVEKMMRKHFCELKLDAFIGGISGDLWVASFYSPMKCKRYEGKGSTAPLAICRAARETFLGLFGD